MRYQKNTLGLFGALVGIILIAPITILITPFLLVSVIFKILRKFEPRTVDWKETVDFDSKLGWRPKPNLDVHIETDGIYHLTTGSDGWRGNFDINKSNTVVIGDSFVFGQGVDDKDFFASKTKLASVKPFGGQGYGAVHYLLLLKTFSKEIQNKLVIWFVYIGNDFRESIRPSSYGYWFPYIHYNRNKKVWMIETNHISEKKLSFNFERGYKTSIPEIADLFSKNYLSDYAYEAFEYLAKEAKKHCEQNGAKFAIVTIPMRWMIDGSYTFKLKRNSGDPDKFSIEYPDKKVAEICKNNDIIFRPCLKDFTREDYLPNDLHWNRQGNYKVAKIIDNIYTSHKNTDVF